MSEQRTVINGTATPDLSPEQTTLNSQIAERLKKKQNLRAIVLERGSSYNSMDVKLPPTLHGEWIRNEPKRIMEAMEIGFQVDREYAKKQLTADGKFLHDANGDGSAVIGDAIFMVCDKETRDIVEELRHEEYIRRHGKPGDVNQLLAEEKAFLTNQSTIESTRITSSTGSRATPVAIDVSKKKE